MDNTSNDSKFLSPMVSAWTYQVAFIKGEPMLTPMERAKQAVDTFLANIRSQAHTGPMFLA